MYIVYKKQKQLNVNLKIQKSIYSLIKNRSMILKKNIWKKNKRPDGSFIPNITSIDFEQELLSLSELKHVATIADIEELTGFVIDISGYFLNEV